MENLKELSSGITVVCEKSFCEAMFEYIFISKNFATVTLGWNIAILELTAMYC